MAQLILNLPDTVIPRLNQAFGRKVNGVLVPASIADVREEIKNFLKSRVIDREVETSNVQRRAELSSEDWN